MATGALAAYRGPLAALARGGSTREYDDGSSAVPGGVTGDPERVIVVGAGWSGLTAANALRNAGVECVVVEGRRRLGGRAHTVEVGDVPVDLGCSWIHEPIGNPLTRFANQAGVAQTNADIELDAAIIRFFDGVAGADVPLLYKLETFSHLVQWDEEIGDINDELGPGATARDGIIRYLDNHHLSGDRRRRAEFLLRLVVQQGDAIDWRRLSLDYIANFESEYTGVGQGNFPVGGYRGLIAAIAAGTKVRLGQRVLAVEQEGRRVRVRARDRDSGALRTFKGSHVIVTAPLGVLRHGDIAFEPGLPPAKRKALSSMSPGDFEKVALTFAEPFWEKGLETHILHLSERTPLEFPLFLDLHRISGVPTLVALCSARFAHKTFRRRRGAIIDEVLGVLGKVIGGAIPAPEAASITSWRRDSFTRGAYSSIPPGKTLDSCDVLARPLQGRVLFAGEHTSRARIGYADGAFSTGIREAKRLLRSASVRIGAG